MKSLSHFLLVFLGGGLGAALRHWIHLLPWNHSYPYSTLFVNVVGSLCLGALFVLGKKHNLLPDTLYLFLGAGLLGGFTTFSTFSLATVELFRESAYLKASLHVLLNNSLALGGCFLGAVIAGMFR